MGRRFLLIASLLLTAHFAVAQSENPSNYINIETKIDSLIAPDLITLDIRLTTDEGAGRKGLDKAKDRLYSTLKGFGVDIESDLYVKSIGSFYNKKGNDTEISQIFSITIDDSTTAQEVITACQEQNIAVTISKLELSRREEIERELYRQALLKAKEEATYLAEVLDQSIGKAISITKRSYVNYQNRMVTMSYAATESDSINTEPVIVQKVSVSASVNVNFYLL